MTNHPNRSLIDPSNGVVDKALGLILQDHEQFHETDSAGRRNIRRNIRTVLHEMYSGHTVDQLVADYRSLNG